MVSFLGLRTEFPVLVCDLSTDAIIGTDTLGSILPHTLDIKKGLLFTEGGVSLQLQRRDAALSGRVFTVGHCSIPPCCSAALHYPDSGRPVIFVERPVGRAHGVRREYGLSGGPDAG